MNIYNKIVIVYAVLAAVMLIALWMLSNNLLVDVVGMVFYLVSITTVFRFALYLDTGK